MSAVITDAVGNTINLGNASGAFTAAPVSIVLTDAVGNTLNVGPGVVAKYDATAQAANIGATTLYAVPANGGGMYRIIANVVLTQAATTSSTLPNCACVYTDNDSGVSENIAFIPTSTANVVGTVVLGTNVSGMLVVNAKANTNIQIGTNSYASSGATPMQYAVHIKLEYLGA